MTAAGPSPGETVSARIGECWLRFWFTPASGRPLAIVRMLTAGLGLCLAWSYAADLQAWFGPRGLIDQAMLSDWRPPFAVSIFDACGTVASLWAAFAVLVLAFLLLLVGCLTSVVSVIAALFWAGLLHRGPMLAGPADDCLMVLLWCIAIGPAGQWFSIDRRLAGVEGKAGAQPTVRARIALGLVQVHAAVITAAAILSQLKGDVWWDGTAVWFLQSREVLRIIDLRATLAGSDYVLNLLTHAITAFEMIFAVGIWFPAVRMVVSRVALVGWPLVGLLVGEPLWGMVMAVFAVPTAIALESDTTS
jgi:hypothetical protein